MKKLLVIFAILCAVLNGSAFNASRLTSVNGTFGAYLEQNRSDAYTYWASYEIEGANVTYTIYEYSYANNEYDDEYDYDKDPEGLNKMWRVEKKFTLHNVISDKSYPVGINLEGTPQEVIVSSGVFTNWNNYTVTIYSNGKYLVYTDEGNIIGELPLNEKGDVGMFMMSAICEGNPIYVTNDKDRGSYTVWAFEQGSSVNEVSASGSNTKAYPNPLSEDQTLTVELPYPADQNTIVVISDLNGRQEVKKNIAVGQQEVKIAANRLNNGINIYTLIYSDGKSFSGKLIKE